MAKTSLSANEWASAGFKDFVIEAPVSPYVLQPAYIAGNQIQNRTGIALDLKPAMGNERIHVRSLAFLPRELGPNGEPVWEMENKDPRVRFVGIWASQSGDQGSNAGPSTNGTDFIEIAFYGTGLNVLSQTNGSARDFRYTLDGGSESANFLPNSGVSSGITGGRGYAANEPYPVVSGLTAGFHIVKIRTVGGNTGRFMGFEIINERSNVLINSGSSFAGMKKQSLSSALTSTYNSSITGTRGGRVIKYLLDGAVSEAVQLVDASQLNSTAANHANEEIIRTVNWREFGSNRSDDFSTLSSNRNSAYLLDDGTTYLIGSGVGLASQVNVTQALQMQNAGSFVTLTFVGTGLDMVSYGDGVGSADSHVLSVDGTTVATLSVGHTPANNYVYTKVVSGLPYGTHIFKILRSNNAGGSAFNIEKFVIYGSKKPAIPAGAIELADYNVLADYSATAAVAQGAVSTGVIRKFNTREAILVGAGWSIGGVGDSTSMDSVFQVVTSTSGNFIQYTFFGTGIEWRSTPQTAAVNISVTLNGSSNLSTSNSSWPAIVSSLTQQGTGLTFTGSTGTISGTGSIAGRSALQIRGLPIGLYTIKITTNNTTAMYHDEFDIVTPIHSHDKGFFKIGSLSLQDSRNTRPVPVAEKSIDLSKAKAWVIYDQINTRIKAAFNVSAVIDVSTGVFIVYWTRPFKNERYAIVATTGERSCRLASTGAQSVVRASFVRIETVNNSDTGSNAENTSVVVFGELENEEVQ